MGLECWRLNGPGVQEAIACLGLSCKLSRDLLVHSPFVKNDKRILPTAAKS